MHIVEKGLLSREFRLVCGCERRERDSVEREKANSQGPGTRRWSG